MKKETSDILWTFAYPKAENLLADTIEQESDFEGHRDQHDQLEPRVPPGYPEEAIALEDSPPPAVPPVADAGKHLQAKRSWFMVT